MLNKVTRNKFLFPRIKPIHLRKNFSPMTCYVCGKYEDYSKIRCVWTANAAIVIMTCEREVWSLALQPITMETTVENIAKRSGWRVLSSFVANETDARHIKELACQLLRLDDFHLRNRHGLLRVT